MIKRSINEPCACGSGVKYKKCCAALHKGARAKDALTLMKSRFCAYAMGESKYIMRTTHGKNVDFQDDQKQWAKSIKEFMDTTSFQSLKIIEFIDADQRSSVTFKATMQTNNEESSFIEKSEFIKEKNQWYYLQGEFLNNDK
ncbi:MAG: YchJ family metal-binding protein [Campylobacterota bacterium]|nr:YchJ family metal-binding protein [Campylobacterota bacterium]